MSIPRFQWKGIWSDAMGVQLCEHPVRTRPKERNTTVSIPGRTGTLTLLEDYSMPVFDDFTLTLDCCILPGADIAAVLVWLTGEGHLVFANDAEHYYQARILNLFETSQIMRGRSYYEIKIPFECKPYRRLVTESVVTGSPGNTATAKVYLSNSTGLTALPLVKLVPSAAGASGTITFGQGSTTMTFTSLPKGGIVIDSENCLILSPDLGSSYARYVKGAMPYIPAVTGVSQASANNVALTIKNTVSGKYISSVEITPHWRRL